MAMFAMLTLAPGAGARGSAHGLKMFEARTEAQAEGSSFTLRRNLTESHVARCTRDSARSVDCAAVATGENASATIVCALHVRVRAVYRGSYWTIAAAITRHRCASTAKERLTYAEAIRAMQPAADAFAGRPTTINFVARRDEVTYSGSARWERPSDPPNQFIPTETCSVDLVASLADGRVSVVTEGFLCY